MPQDCRSVRADSSGLLWSALLRSVPYHLVKLLQWLD